MMLTAVAVAACGTASAATLTSGGSSTTTSTTGQTAAPYGVQKPSQKKIAAFIACMKAHGAKSFAGTFALRGPLPPIAQTTTQPAPTTTSQTSTGARTQTVTASSDTTSAPAGPQTQTSPAKPVMRPGLAAAVVSGGSRGGGGFTFAFRGAKGKGHVVSAKKMARAMKACGKLLPKPKPPTAAQLKSMKRRAALMRACLKQHGVAPEPATYGVPAPIGPRGALARAKAKSFGRVQTKAKALKTVRKRALKPMPKQARRLMRAMKACGPKGPGLVAPPPPPGTSTTSTQTAPTSTAANS